MKKIYLPIAIILFFTTTSMKCYKDSANCHHSIDVMNSSPSTIYFFSTEDSSLTGTPDPKLKIHGAENRVDVNSVYHDEISYCWESQIAGAKYHAYYYYFFDGSLIDNNTPWDTIVAKNLYLKKVKYDMDLFHSSGQKVSYP